MQKGERIGHSDSTLLAPQESVSNAAPTLDGQGLDGAVEGRSLATVKPVALQGVMDSVPSDKSIISTLSYNLSLTAKGPFVPDAGIPTTLYNRVSASSQLSALPFGPASDAAQSLGGDGLGQVYGMASKDTRIGRGTSWFTVLMLCSFRNPSTATPASVDILCASSSRHC